jgi:flagellar biosynthesis protein FlhB
VAEQAGEKKHEATAHRRLKAREQGQVARSQDLGSALVLLAAVALLWWCGPDLGGSMADIMKASLTQERFWESDARSVTGWIAHASMHCLWAMTPLLIGICLVIIVNSWGQGGILFLPEKLAFDLKRIDPLSGLKRLVDIPNAVRIGFGVLKVMLVALVILLGLWGKWDLVQTSQELSVGEIGKMVWSLLLDMGLRVAILLLVLALLDYGFQRWKFEQDIRMTDEEMREEIKMMNGDPQLIARRRAVQRQLVMNRMHSSVPESDVVITNPTELAVALKFDADTMAAPVLVAKGAGHVAARIRKVALDSGIPVIERKPLAQALFKHVEIGATIPSEQYAAVAEVLRYVYQLKGKKIPTAE